MPTEKHQALFERLFDRTNAGELKWQESVGKGTFMVSFADYSIEVSQVMSEEATSPTVSLIIRNAEGAVIEDIADAEIGGRLDPHSRKAFYNKSEQLFEMARRAALGADKALDSILKQLGE